MSVNTVTPEALQLASSTRSAKTSPLVYARIAGFLYLVITVAAIIAHMVVPSTLFVPGDAAATASNIAGSESLFRVGTIGSELIILLSEIVLSVLLYVLFKPVGKTLSLIAAVSRLAMTTIHGINLLNYGFVLLLLVSGADYLTVLGEDQVRSLIMLFLDAHHFGFTLGIAFLTLHVFILGYLIFKSGFIPRIFGLLFLVAAVGYLVDSAAILLVSNYQSPEILMLPIAAAEIAFPLWLLVKGVNVAQWKRRAAQAS